MSEANDEVKNKSQQDSAKAGGSGPEQNYDLDLILDIPLDISVELGKVKMPVNELLRLGQGSIIELAKSVGEPLDIYVNNKLVAKGEVVILDEKFGIRVADIINPIERVKSLSK
jgi:flagellar motor switch protein FliN/FliY